MFYQQAEGRIHRKGQKAPVVNFISTPTGHNDWYEEFVKSKGGAAGKLLNDEWRKQMVYGDFLPYVDEAAPISQEAYDALKPRPIGKPEALGAGYGEGWPTPQAPPQPKSRLVFYKSNKARDMLMMPGDVCLTGPMQERELILKHFDNGDLKTLFVHVSTGMGWKTKLTSDECEVTFTNEHIVKSYKEQAKARLSPARHGHETGW